MSGARGRWSGGRTVTLVLASVLALALAPSMACAYGPDSNWEQVGPGTAGQTGGVVNSSPSSLSNSSRKSSQDLVACGELGRPAQPPYTTIMARLNGIWGTHFHIYQSVATIGPHARKGGCVFYNRPYLSFLTSKWMDIRNPEEVKPMLYAIFAHELGHLYHRDFSAARQRVPTEEKELEADHFAGYTLYLLHIKFDAYQLARYYRLVGDNYFDVSNNHGSGNERARAFENGYNRARLGLPEAGAEPAAGFINKEDGALP